DLNYVHVEVYPMNTEFEACIRACNKCAVACETCASACLQENNVAMMADCIRLDRDCADACRMAAALMARERVYAGAFCNLSAQKSAPNMMQNTARTALRCAMSAPKSVVAWLHETFYSKGLIKNISRSRALGALPRKAQRSGCRRSLDIS